MRCREPKYQCDLKVLRIWKVWGVFVYIYGLGTGMLQRGIVCGWRYYILEHQGRGVEEMDIHLSLLYNLAKLNLIGYREIYVSKLLACEEGSRSDDRWKLARGLQWLY
jgi:hypothetical protein